MFNQLLGVLREISERGDHPLTVGVVPLFAVYRNNNPFDPCNPLGAYHFYLRTWKNYHWSMAPINLDLSIVNARGARGSDNFITP